MTFDALINNVISRKIPCYFISPHPDDAVFSAGGLLQYLAGKTSVSVITVFTEAGTYDSLSATRFIKQCGFSDAQELFVQRRKEDQEVLNSIGITVHHSGFTDGLWRTTEHRSLMSRLIPAFQLRYPTYRFHIVRGAVHPDDQKLSHEVAAELLRSIPEPKEALIFCPVSIGNHVDHRVIRAVCEKTFPNVVLWSDMPYALHTNVSITSDLTRGYEPHDWLCDSEKKVELARGYGSQFAAVFNEQSVSDNSKERYYVSPTQATFLSATTSKPTITVGIPAYNEEGNIRTLLHSILNQKLTSADIKEIIVVADGCTDNTVGLVRSIPDPRIALIELEGRNGIAAAQNIITQRATSDMLVLINADVIPAQETFLETLIQPLLRNEHVGLVGARTIPATPRTWFERVIAESHMLKNRMYEHLSSRNNVYLCHGRARAFSRSLYETIVWPPTYSEDAYSYFFCITSGHRFVFNPDAEVVFRSPRTLHDHYKQSMRFMSGKKNMRHFFNKPFVARAYHIPYRVLIQHSIIHSIQKPLLTLSYLGIAVSLRILSRIRPMQPQPIFEPSITSKKVNVEY